MLNEEVYGRAGIQMELMGRVDHRVTRWSGHEQRMDAYCTAKTMLRSDVSIVPVYTDDRF